MVLRALAVLLLLASPALAGHVPCPPKDCLPVVPIPGAPYVSGATLQSFDADVRVTGDLADTRLALTLANPGQAAAQATVTFPMPASAALVRFNLTVEDVVLHGRVEERSQAQASYDGAVARGEAAALLRTVDERRVELLVNLPPGTERAVAAQYLEWVELAGATRIYRLPLSQLPPTVGSVEVEVRIGQPGLASPAAPLLPVAFQAADGSATGRFSATAPGALQDLLVSWDAPVGWSASLVTSAREGPGHGVVTVCFDAPRALARDVVFVLDRSGSMAGEKMVQARAAMAAMLPTLGPGDRYDVVAFDDHIETFAGSLHAPDPADAPRVAQVEARGGTDIDGGLQAALRLLGTSGAGVPMVVFLTDGLPSAGITDHDEIIERYLENDARGAAIHVVAIGLDADHTFLADLALRSGGSYVPLDPRDGQLAGRLERLFDILAHPTLRDLGVTVEGVGATTVLPTALPLVYEDACLHQAFKGTFGADAVVKVQGRDATGPVERSFAFPAAAIPVHADVGSLWGKMRVAGLLGQERAGLAVRAEVVATAVELRQLSPYTSWVVTQDAPQPAAAASGGATMTSTATSTAMATSTGTPPMWDLGGAQYVANEEARDDAFGPPGGQAGATSSQPTPGLGLLALVAVAALAASWRARRF